MAANEETSLKQLFQSMSPEGASVIEGTVTSASPLKITLTNDSVMVLGSNSLIIPRHLTNYTVTIDIKDGTIDSTTSDGDSLSDFKLTEATMIVKNALKTGEAVYLLAFNNGKRYYVLDRKG